MSSMSEMIGEYFYLIWWEDIESWIKKEWWKYDLRIQISGFRSGYFSSLRWNLIKHVRYSPPLNWSNPFLNRSYLRPRDGYLKYMNRISLSGWKHDRFLGLRQIHTSDQTKIDHFFLWTGKMDWEDWIYISYIVINHKSWFEIMRGWIRDDRFYS